MRRFVALLNSRQSDRCNIISSRRLFSSTATAEDDDCQPILTQQSNKHTAHVRSALSSGPLPYEKGWAWQHVMLHRRLNYLRQMEKRSTAAITDNSKHQHHDENDNDCILLFEHEPVYTLGRGASEDHLTFINNEIDGGADKRRRLNRTYRGKDASRLNIDNQNLQSSSESMSLEDEVNHLWEQSLHNSNRSNFFPPVCAPNGAPIYRIERGGEVTYHGPGQLVMYPLLNLKQHSPPYQQDLHWYLRQIEEVIIQTLEKFNIQSNRDDINTGVWVGKNKIAAVGVSSSRWITTHGLALNVSPNLNHFDKDIITPCGIEERGVTSIANLLGEEGGGGKCCCPTVEEVGDVALRCFEDVFNVELIRHDDTNIS